MSSHKVYSFDVYDTCISRTYEKPSDLFYHLGTLISPNQENDSFCDKFAIDFSKARVIAENLACKQHGRRRSCRIEEIYSFLSVPIGCPLSKSEIMDLELQLEDKCTYGINSTKTIIDNLRSQGKRIIFISDMYLDTSFIKKLLIKHDFFQEGDQLYVSSESTHIKRTGMLFKLVMQSEQVKAEDIFHTGDNLTNDIRAANRLDIQTAHIQDTHIHPYEIAFSSEMFTPLERRINSIPKYIRLTNSNSFTNTELKLFSIIVPAIISFTLWSLQMARELGLKRLYFVSRNGELPYKIAKLFESQFPNIEINFLYGSRKAWLLPSINASSDWLHALPKKSVCSISEVLQGLSFDEEDIYKIGTIANSIGLSIDAIEKSQVTSKNFIRLIEKSESHEIIYAKIIKSRNLVTDYFKQEGLLDDDKWAIVDSGWKLNCQAYLNRILKSISPHHKTKGFYFGIDPKHLPEEMTGPAHSFTEKTSIFSQRGYVVENCFLFSALQSTCAYTREQDSIVPEFSNITHSDFDIGYSEKMYLFIKGYVNAMSSIGLPISLLTDNKEIFIKKLSRLISTPDIDIAKYVTNLKINENVNHTDENSVPLSRKLTSLDILNQIAGFFTTKVKRPQIWMEASVRLSNPIIGFVFRLLIFANRIRYLGLHFRIRQIRKPIFKNEK